MEIRNVFEKGIDSCEIINRFATVVKYRKNLLFA